MFFDWFARLHPKYRTPNNALIGQALWATVLLTFAVLAENSYEIIIDFFSATSTVFNIMVFAAVWVMRKKFPDVDRPYRAWLYPWSLVGILAIYFAFLVITLITALVPSLFGLGLTASGAVYYYFKVVRGGAAEKLDGSA
jgi:amino acid transporter